MKFTLSWLKTYLDTDASLEQISETLTAIGLEVEEVIDRSAELAPFTVAEIKEAEQHPNADRLRVCQVNTGSETLQIVCGAPNARAGIKVVLASVGTVIPTNEMKIKASEIRGVKSNGMLCSATELGIGEDSEGIMELPDGAKLGQPFAEEAGLNDPLIDIAITPNRGDCLGVYGIARDLAAAGLGTLKKLAITPVKGQGTSPINVSIKDTAKAPQFIGRHIKGVKNGESPEWLQHRLISIGHKPISALVDITNYLTFDLGRPAHVFDAGKLKGNLTVRDANDGETFIALDEKEYTLQAGMTVIADEKGPAALGGVIGGLESGCGEGTTDVFLEIAEFDPIHIAETGRALQIESDARYRFERGIDSGFLNDAAEHATQLILDICGGEASELVVEGKAPKQRTLTFNTARVKELIGIDVKPAEITTMLEAIGCEVSGKDTLEITIPHWRHDIAIEADIIEEITRLHGYNNIPSTPMPAGDGKAALSPDQRRRYDMRRVFAGRGMREAVTYSFMDNRIAAQLTDTLVKLDNPISSELDVMRPSILPNLVQAAVRNADRGYPNAALFELGATFTSDVPGEEQRCLSAIRTGALNDRHPDCATRKVDAMDAKADAYAALSLAVPTDNLRVTRDVPSHYHPGRAGALLLGKNVLAYFGELHPAVLGALDCDHAVGCEILLDNLPATKQKATQRKKLEASNLQPLARDFAFIVNDDVESGAVLATAKGVDKKLITNVALFDVYSGKGIDDGKKSLAINVTLQPTDKTLTDDEIEALSQKIITAVESDHGGVLRG